MNAQHHMADKHKPDHDLLIELKSQMVAVREDIKELKDNLVGRVKALEDNCISKLEVEKHMALLKVDNEKAITETAKSIRQEYDLKLLAATMESARLGKIVYGACALILTAFLAGLIVLVWK